jgi:PBSX family phage terminase large subunit
MTPLTDQLGPGLPLSPMQIRSVVEATARINIWQGAVRSGKTIASLLAWLLYVANAPRGGHLLMIGKTKDTIARNLWGPLMDPDLFGPLARLCHYTRGASTGTILGRTIEVIGANDVKAEDRLRGLTSAGALVDEVTLLPEVVWTMLLSRLSVPGARLYATTNPDGPAHWLRKTYLLRSNVLDLRTWAFTLDDNPALDPQYVAALKNEYTGLWYRRFINGEWCLAEGAIYDMWDADRHVVTELPYVERWHGVGIDYGTVNPFSALLLGMGEDGRLYLADEWRWDSKLKRRQLTDAEYSQQIRQWVSQIPRPADLSGGRGVSPEWWVVDPSAASFRTQLWRDGHSNVQDGDNAVLDGIRLVSSLLATDRLRVHERCTGWIEEVPGYSWDEDKATEKGEDAPIKVADHSLDAGRYVTKTTEWAWRPRIAREAA